MMTIEITEVLKLVEGKEDLERFQDLPQHMKEEACYLLEELVSPTIDGIHKDDVEAVLISLDSIKSRFNIRSV